MIYHCSAGNGKVFTGGTSQETCLYFTLTMLSGIEACQVSVQVIYRTGNMYEMIMHDNALVPVDVLYQLLPVKYLPKTLLYYIGA